MGLSMGQWLCVPMVLIGVAMVFWSFRKAASLRT
jgi:phosphatidylglycerol:prolipoprotein diacylglycerol transferase